MTEENPTETNITQQSTAKKIFTYAWKKSKQLFKVFVFSLPIQAGLLYFGFQEYVVNNPGPQISEKYIQDLLTQDSAIYYRDGVTIMDAISYKGAHRYYVEYEELPENWLNAIVSMEDQNFWTHHGIEPTGIVKAIYRNLQGTRSGGSTLTQQTAKNLFDRDQYQKQTEEKIKKIIQGEEAPRSKGLMFSAKIWAKAWEALNALRLEEHFTKKNIIEYYANQFQVHGTGRGLGVAARYFFDKTPMELTLHECAYLAAIVKGPNNYNPFTKTTAETREETIEKAVGRTQSVLNRMRDDGYITQAERDEIYLEEIPFNRGYFRFDNSIIYDLIQEELQHPAIQKKLKEAGIANISTAGLHISTSIDEDIQRKAHYAFRHQLSELSGYLKDYPSKAPLRRPTGIRPQLSRPPKPFQFYGAIVKKEGTIPVVDIGGVECTLSKKSIKETEKRLNKKNLHEELRMYSRILVSRNVDETCSIEIDGSLQGGLIATQKGMIRAIVGGRNNRFLNRAIATKVQLGSTWKPLIYAAAMELGWSMVDQLDNHHNAFYYSGSWFFPKGHDPARSLSMMWTGVQSENRASVWLLYHLSDRLPIHRTKELAELVGLTQRKTEDKKSYKVRLKTWGINSTKGWLKSISFRKAQREILLSMEEGEEKRALMSLNYISPLMEKLGQSSIKASGERKHNSSTLSFHYNKIRERFTQCKKELLPIQKQYQKGTEKETGGFLSFLQETPLPRVSIPKKISWHPFLQRVVCGKTQDTVPLTWELLEDYQIGEGEDFPPIWIDNLISDITLSDIEDKMKQNQEKLAQLDPYDLDYLLFHNDFTRQLNMRFVDTIAQKLGLPIKDDNEKNEKQGYMSSSIPLGLSMTLGSTTVSLAEMNQIYTGLLSGQQYKHTEIDRPIIIDRIIDDTGRLLYKAQIEKTEVLNPIVGKQLQHMLRSVVEQGTGRRAKGKIKHNDVDIPVIGKTGTTNDFKRAAFVGMIPYATEDDQWNFAEGVALSVSVGFDYERPLRGRKNGRRYSLDGSRGGLPIWIDAAQAMAQSDILGTPSVQIPWEKPEYLTSFSDIFIDKRDKEHEIENWFYSEDKDNLYRIMNINNEPTLLQKTKPPVPQNEIEHLNFDDILEEEQEEEQEE